MREILVAPEREQVEGGKAGRKFRRQFLRPTPRARQAALERFEIACAVSHHNDLAVQQRFAREIGQPASQLWEIRQQIAPPAAVEAPRGIPVDTARQGAKAIPLGLVDPASAAWQ